MRHEILNCEVRNTHRTLVGKYQGKIPSRRHEFRWEENIKTDLTETGYEDVE
jgi:hypothetical protein